MNLENALILVKGFCLTYIPFAGALATGLVAADLGVATIFGLPIKVWALLFTASSTGVGGLLAFISTSFGEYMTKRANGNGNGNSH